MFVTSNDFAAVRSYYQKNLAELYAPGELKIILKYLFLKRFPEDASGYILADEKRLSESDLLFFRSALKRLERNEPWQYVIGEAEFYGLLLNCDKRALIPRPETEELVDWILSSHDKSDLNTIVDLCSGSGCIALALKSQCKESEVIALEWSTDAIGLIEDNAEKTGLEVAVLHANALTGDYRAIIDSDCDIIVSNPPYIPAKDRKQMKANVLDFEPEMALFVSNEDPLIFYQEILRRAKKILTNNGWVYFEIHEELADDVRELFKENNFVNIEMRKDLQGKDRMVRGQMVNSTHEPE